MSNVTKIVIYLIVGAIILDLVTHASGVAKAGGTAVNGFNSALKTIAG